MSDFESGLIPALRNVFGVLFDIRGCHFHYTSAIYEWAKEHGLAVSLFFPLFLISIILFEIHSKKLVCIYITNISITACLQN